jgi:aminoglycoside N3'-acetyltransferase
VTPLISPLAKGVEFKGKILFFGCTPASSTIIHLLEEEADLPYLKSALCRVRRPDGSAVNVFFPKHLPGCREFYTPDGLSSKFYRRAVERGLKINTTNLGVGTLYMIDAAEIHRIGMELIKEDPNVLLCDSKECSFCGKYRS